jgi:hypothetical protein
MKQGRLQLFMVSTMKQLGNMEMLTHGNIVLKFSIILALELSLKEKFSASTVVFRQK